MKYKIVTKGNKEITPISEVSNNNIYAVILAGNQFGLVTSNDYEKGEYNLRSIERKFTKGNSWIGYDCDTLKELISDVLSRDDRNEVFEFKSFKDFAEWCLQELK